MTQVFGTFQESSMTSPREHYRFSVEQYELMIEHAILGKYDLVELIHGHILEKVRPVSAPHGAVKRHVNQILHDLIDEQAIVSACGSIRLADSMPEPDLFLLQRRDDDYMHAFPLASETLLVIEIADDTLEFDRTVKKKLYALNNIPEYWIYNIYDKQLEVFRQPQPDGTYADSQILTATDRISLVALPKAEIKLGEILDILS
jgi:Uma2 family endonuclease